MCKLGLFQLEERDLDLLKQEVGHVCSPRWECPHGRIQQPSDALLSHHGPLCFSLLNSLDYLSHLVGKMDPYSLIFLLDCSRDHVSFGRRPLIVG